MYIMCVRLLVHVWCMHTPMSVPMCMYMYVHTVHACICVRMLYIYVCMYIMCVCALAYARMAYAYMCVPVCTCMYVHDVHICMCTHAVYLCICVFIFAKICCLLKQKYILKREIYLLTSAVRVLKVKRL